VFKVLSDLTTKTPRHKGNKFKNINLGDLVALWLILPLRHQDTKGKS